MRRQKTFVALDDHIWSSAAYIGLSGDAAKLYCAGYAWCGAHLTDGLLTDADVAALARLLRLKAPHALGAEMVAAGLWAVAPGAHVVVEYLGLNPTTSEVEERLQKGRAKVRDWRSRQQKVEDGAAEPTSLNTALPVTSDGGQVDQGAVLPVTPDPVTGVHHTTPHHTTPPNEALVLLSEHIPDLAVGGAPGVAGRVFEAWKLATGRTGRTVFTTKRRRLVEQVLQVYPEADLLDAVRGWRHDPWEDRPQHTELDVLLRPNNVEKFRDYERNGAPPIAMPRSKPTLGDYYRQIGDQMESAQRAANGGIPPALGDVIEGTTHALDEEDSSQ